MTPLLVGLTYDLRADHLAEGLSEEEAAEFDSEETIAAIEGAIRGMGLRTDRIGHGRHLCQRLVQGDRWDLVFNIAEGRWGRSREAQVPAILELYGIPYTFSDPLTCAVTLDKATTKQLVRAAGLRTPDFHVVRSVEDVFAVRIPFPLFAKPLQEGTGKGVGRASRVSSPAELERVCRDLLARFQQPVLVEAYLPGREVTTGVVGTGARARVVGTMEFTINPDAGDYGFEVKEEWRKYVTYFPMPPGPLREETEALALAAHRVLECRDGSRVDLRMDASGRPAFIEVNPLPGLNPGHSDLPMLGRMHGVDFQALIGAIVESGLERVPAARRSVA